MALLFSYASYGLIRNLLRLQFSFFPRYYQQQNSKEEAGVEAVGGELLGGEDHRLEGGHAQAHLPGQMSRDVIAFVMCKEGSIRVDINGTELMVTSSDILVYSPLHVLAIQSVSTDFCCSAAIINRNRITELMGERAVSIHDTLFLNDHPLINLATDDLQLMELYRNLIAHKLQEEGHSYTSRSIAHIVSAMLHDILGICLLHQEAERQTAPSANDVPSASSIDIPHRFLALLAEDNARHHNVQHFADQLGITSKYLSVVVRTETGKTPSAWIKDMLIKQIRYYLLETNLTIKEICYKLHFENTSFFSKFIKQHLGCSPLEFRNGGNDAKLIISPKIQV